MGRTIVFKERGEILLLKFAQALEEKGKVEQMPKLEGKRMTMFIAPKPGTKKKENPKKEENNKESKKKESKKKDKSDIPQDDES